MKRFIFKFVIFSSITFILACGLDVIISKGLLRMSDYRFIPWNDILTGNASADLVFMGNSRGLSHFEPQTFDSICNTNSYVLGLGGYPFSVELLKYNCYRLYNKKPKCIVQQVDYMTFQDLVAPHNHQSEQFLPLFLYPEMRNELRRVGYSWFDEHCPLYRYFGYQMVIKNGILEFFGIKHYVSDPSYKGHHYENGEWNGGELAKKDTTDANLSNDSRLLFEAFMQRCSDEDIKVILVNSPTYIGATNKTRNLQEVDNYFDSLAAIHNTVYLNYTYDSICYDTANFCVSVHMNPSAVHCFSINLANQLDSIKVLK